MASMRLFSFTRISQQIKARKDCSLKAAFHNEELRISSDLHTELKPKEFRRHWIKQRSRAIWVSLASVLVFQVYYWVPAGATATAYIQKYWKSLKCILEPDFFAPKSARDTVIPVLPTQSLLPDAQLQADLITWFESMDIAKDEGVTGPWLQDLLLGLVPANAFPAEITVKDFVTVVSKTASPQKTLEKLLSSTTQEQEIYQNLQNSLEATKLAARARRQAYEAELKRVEDATYMQLFKEMARKQQDKIAKKLKKHPLSVRLQTRKSELESSLKSLT